MRVQKIGILLYVYMYVYLNQTENQHLQLMHIQGSNGQITETLGASCYSRPMLSTDPSKLPISYRSI